MSGDVTPSGTPAAPAFPVGRRSLLLGGAAAGALTVLAPPATASAAPAVAAVAPPGRSALAASSPLGPPPVPPAVRSRQALVAAGRARPVDATLPLTQLGTTYNLAQVVRWLDDSHFAVGRWDGTMSVFEFETAAYTGPMVTAAVDSPSATGVQMLTPLPNSTIVTSNDRGSLAIWSAGPRGWSGLRSRGAVRYDQALGVATSGAWFPVGRPSTLVVGHDSGYLSLWSFDPATRRTRLLRTVDVRNPDPVNPWGSHVMYGMCPLLPSGPDATVVAGSDDGYVSLVRVPSGEIRSQTVFNPSAQRGINSVSALGGDRLLVANCSVGAEDRNLWYFSVDHTTWALTLLDSTNLIIDPQEVQVFNFDTVWGRYPGGPCWFAGTEEGALWMGTADSGLHVIGRQGLDDAAIGAALDFTAPGRLAAVIHNLFQFSTEATG